MGPNTRINKVSLYNYRNHEDISLRCSNQFIVLNGSNGSGKTNILEAISFFAPGRGLRNTKAIEIFNQKNNSLKSEIQININYDYGQVNMKRHFSNEEKNFNFISVDEEKISNAQLLDFVNILWITPIMEKIMLQSNSEKRNFFDRLIFNIDKNHLKDISKLQKLFSERLALLRTNCYDEDWMGILENNIAEISSKILIKREKFINELNKQLEYIEVPFNSSVVDMFHEITHNQSNSNNFIEEYQSSLLSNRRLDAELNKTTKTINRVKFEINKSNEKSIEVRNCSTGEQKSILLSIFLSVAQIVKDRNNGRSPIILIDEAMAHLDSDHKEHLFKKLTTLNSQVWLSGVSKDLFENISNQTDFFEIKNII